MLISAGVVWFATLIEPEDEVIDTDAYEDDPDIYDVLGTDTVWTGVRRLLGAFFYDNSQREGIRWQE